MLLLLGKVSHLFRHLCFFKPLQKVMAVLGIEPRDLYNIVSALTIRCCGIDTFAANVSFYQVVCFVFSTKDETQGLAHGRLAFSH